jgi:hypothetical protein
MRERVDALIAKEGGQVPATAAQAIEDESETELIDDIFDKALMAGKGKSKVTLPAASGLNANFTRLQVSGKANATTTNIKSNKIQLTLIDRGIDDDDADATRPSFPVPGKGSVFDSPQLATMKINFAAKQPSFKLARDASRSNNVCGFLCQFLCINS